MVAPTAPPNPLRITIVGAGIGGLSAAIFLRQSGHHVTLLEQSRFANELGAAVHVAPNANGLLKRMGLFCEDTGANEALRMTSFLADGTETSTVDLKAAGAMWQHKWLLAHRVHLHAELKRMATADEGRGRPAVLRTSSRVLDVDAATGVVTLASGEKIEADLVVGADGVHSMTRAKLPGAENVEVFGSGKSAFRFLIERAKALGDRETEPYARLDGHLQMFFARDRRVVIYPTSNNELLNFVCIHPTAESEVQQQQASDQPVGGWNQTGQLSKMLEVYKDFAPGIVKILAMADEETLKVWELLDMEKLPTWTHGKLVCIGDAAHPFTPHQGQGAAQAIEDAASLAVALPLGVLLSELPSRLRLYEKCRYERASTIQEYSRVAGKDVGSGPPVDAQRFVAYNLGHDEWDFSSQQLREHLAAQKPGLWNRMPVSFGPMPGPRQDVLGRKHDGRNATFTTASIKFRTSRTVLQNLLPTSDFKFSSPATNAYATFSATTLGNVAWLGGKGYTHFGLYIHGVEHTGQHGETVRGTYLPLLFENLADPILSGREELGMPKLWCELDVHTRETEGQWSLKASWLGEEFCTMEIRGLAEASEQPKLEAATGANEGLLWYKYVPKSGQLAVGETRQADAAYAVLLPNSEEAKVEKKVDKSWKGTESLKVTFNSLGEDKLPTLHHIVQRLVEVPVYECVEATVVKGTGMSDVSGARVLL